MPISFFFFSSLKIIGGAFCAVISNP
uniref:Uncharacterized protein n=1 Tax=Anguilla anguilla TaxID=7936 RepID=A0A0E9SWR2_ANGAN